MTDWNIIASKLYAALKSAKMAHAPGCDASTCAVCKQGYEACLEFSSAQERDNEFITKLIEQPRPEPAGCRYPDVKAENPCSVCGHSKKFHSPLRCSIMIAGNPNNMCDCKVFVAPYVAQKR